MVWWLNCQGMKNCKSTKSFCLSILTIYTNGCPRKFWHVYWWHVYFFSLRFLNMCGPRTTFYLLRWAGTSGLASYGSGPGCLLSWLWMVNAGLLGFIQSEIFLQMKFIIFQGCSMKQAEFLPKQPVSKNQLFIQPLLPVSECYFT